VDFRGLSRSGTYPLATARTAEPTGAQNSLESGGARPFCDSQFGYSVSASCEVFQGVGKVNQSRNGGRNQRQ